MVGSNRFPFAGSPISMHPIAIQLAGADARYEDVPVVVRTIRRGVDRDQPGGAGIVVPIKEE